MNRRGFIVLTSGAIAWPRIGVGHAQMRAHRIALIFSDGLSSEMARNPSVKAFVDALRDLGYREGQNLNLERRSAEGRGVERAGEIGAEVVGAGVDVIVVASTLVAREMMRVTKTVPIVMAVSAEPIARGVVTSLARPGGNVTGFTMQATPEIDTKRLQLLKDAIPSLSRVAFLGLKSDWDNMNGQALRAGARRLGITLVLAEHERTNYANAFASIDKDPPGAVFVPIQPASYANRKLIFDFMLSHKLPATYPWRQFVDAGGLMSYGANLPDLFRRAAGYVDQILKGAKPGDLPIQQPTKFEFVLNLKAAKAINLEMPPLFVAQADEVIE